LPPPREGPTLVIRAAFLGLAVALVVEVLRLVGTFL